MAVAASFHRKRKERMVDVLVPVLLLTVCGQAMTQCPSGWYGDSCAQVCGRCSGPNTCDATTGHCPPCSSSAAANCSVCQSHYLPPFCNQTAETEANDNQLSREVLITVIAVPIVIVVAVAVSLLVWFCLKRRRRPAQKEGGEEEDEDESSERSESDQHSEKGEDGPSHSGSVTEKGTRSRSDRRSRRSSHSRSRRRSHHRSRRKRKKRSRSSGTVASYSFGTGCFGNNISFPYV